MRIVCKKTQKLIAEGKFDTVKISDMDIDKHYGKDSMVFFRYSCDELATSGDFKFLALAGELTSSDELVGLEANGDDWNNSDNIIAHVQLTPSELRRLLCHIINHAVKHST